VTAVASNAYSQEAKVLSILAEAVPTAKRVAYVGVGFAGEFYPVSLGYVRAATNAASQLGLSIITIAASDPGDEQAFRNALARAASENAEMIQFGQAAAVATNAPIIAGLALAALLPAIAPFPAFAQSGGLLSYGSNIPEDTRKTAGYAALIINGAKPGDLPVLQPTLFDFIVNQKTAKALGITIPASVLLQATIVIQ
jgi:putative ABC transport system substrate-binding protein